MTAAWLHDIGYAPERTQTGLNPLDGARYLRDRVDVDPEVIRLVAHHTGAWVEAEERGLDAELAAFAMPRQDLLDLVTTADIVTGPSRPPQQDPQP